MKTTQPIYSMCIAGGVDLAMLRAVVGEWLPHTTLHAPPLCLSIRADTWELCIPRSAGLRTVHDLEARLRARIPAVAVAIMALTVDMTQTTETVDLRPAPPQ
jgi:hypothetical protein